MVLAIGVPFRNTLYPARPEPESLAPFQLMSMRLLDCAAAARPVGVVGGTESGGSGISCCGSRTGRMMAVQTW